MALGDLFGQVMNAITNHSGQQQHTGFDPSGLLNEVQGLFSQHAENTGQVLPASQDPYGDPADAPMSSGRGYGSGSGGYGNVLPASQDPLGDPADDADRARGIRPASEDPLGDPADRAA